MISPQYVRGFRKTPDATAAAAPPFNGGITRDKKGNAWEI